MFPLIRRSVRRLNESGYSYELEELNKEGDCKFVAVADCELAKFTTSGFILQTPPAIMGIQQWLSEQFHQNKRVFAAIETDEGDLLFLLFQANELKNIVAGDDAAGLLENANLDTGFATDRGLSVLTAANTVVKKGSHEDLYFFGHEVLSEHTYVFQPHSKVANSRTDSFEIHFVVDKKNPKSKSNMAATEAWIASDILTMKQNSPEMSFRESLKVEPAQVEEQK